MSPRDYDLVQSEAADEPAIAIPASPPPRNPVEDADPSYTRKRPRLGSGSNSLRAMSTEPDSSNNDPASPRDKQVEMTIRPYPPAEAIEADGASSSPEDVPSAQSQSPVIAASTEDDEPGSPPVMVIDDDDDVESSAGFMVQMDAEDYFEQFPHGRHGNYLQALQTLTQHIQGSGEVHVELFLRLSQWLLDLPEPADNLHSFYVNKAMFWDEFANMVAKVLSRRYQWMTTLNAGHDNDMSRFPFGDHAIDDVQINEIFCGFLGPYMRLCSYLMLVDVHLLSQSRPDEIYPLPLFSQKHMRHLHSLLRSEKVPIFHLLHKEYSADVCEMSNRLHRCFLEANGAQNLLRLVDEVFHKVPPNTQLAVASWASQILSSLGWAIYELPNANKFINRSEFYRGTLLFFRKYGGELENPSTVGDAALARDIIQNFCVLLHEICQWSDEIASELVDDMLDFSEASSPIASSAHKPSVSKYNNYRQDPAAFPILVTNAWKFKILRRYLVKGRMELRVMSIAYMDAALVEIYREYNTVESAGEHTVVQYLAEFLLHGRVVDYIISVDSHPQLISRSGNIVGFLVVTRRWTDSQADDIWRTVSNSPDPRVVTAMMVMLRSIIALMQPSDHLYLCQKVYDVPIEKCTVDILRFLKEVTVKLVDKFPPADYDIRGPSAQPWSVLIRIIRETSPSKDVTKHLLDLHAEADEQLRLIATVVPRQERQAIYRECAQQIATRSPQATGSMRVILILASPPTQGDNLFFENNTDLTRQILEETPSFVRKERENGHHPHQLHALRYRLEVLALMISRAEKAMPLDVCLEIWDHIVGKHALSNTARDLAWTHLLHTIKVFPNNWFCKRLVLSYVPKMDPEFYTPAMFEFVANYNFPMIRQTTSTEDGEVSLLQIPGADLLWLIMLSSPKGTIEERAARLLAARYVAICDSEDFVLREVENAHVILVEKCMQELRTASQALRKKSVEEPTSMDVDLRVSDKTVEQCQDRFRRILIFQKQLLEFIRQRPEFNRTRADSKVDAMETEVPFGNAITVRYQCGNDRQSVSMAAEHTLEDLYRRLCHATGFTKINLFANGQRLNVAEKAHQKISDSNLGGQLLVQRADGAETTRPMPDSIAGSSAFELNVVKHFDELFSWMDSDDTTSQLLFDFLSLFPARASLADSVTTGEASPDQLFPPGRFFQAKYAARALQSKLREQLRNSALNESFLANSVKFLVKALLNPLLISDTLSGPQELRLAADFVNVLLEFLRERLSSATSSSYFSDGALLADRLLTTLSVALEAQDGAAIVQDSYAAILEASLHSQTVWEAFINNPETPRVHRVLLLVDPRQSVREHVERKIASICGGDLPSTCPIDKAEVASRFWSIVADILPDAVHYSKQSVQLFNIAEHVFRTNDAYERHEESLRSLLTQWSDLLLNYGHEEFAGREEVDHVVLGFTKLLLCCVFSLKSFKKPLNASILMAKIFRKYLFVKSSQSDDSEASESANEPTALPILESCTRRELYDLMISLADERSTYDTLLQLAREVELGDFDPVLATVSVDRSMEIRSCTGYVGLYNPRNICYMNSLLTQLFMNLNFRKFILGLDINEGDSSRKLLFETQRLFAEMQNSLRKSTDPRRFAACVSSLDKTPIDIGVQMDADEFYNLLFDQWEEQLVDPEDKQTFRSFYGGQTLNQVRSKECKHVSERTEPFFAVPCDVQGKANLQESLQSFVDGDAMEGDNKYKCESCGGKFVDAVRRTCLKDVPDNMIFHLKRFEFDLNDFSRRKIHDYFAFPNTIDMSPYNAEYVDNSTMSHAQDMFDLVGVLVHMGTCENGHYYSYIRERPCPEGENTTSTWMEFNDRDVSPFDASEIPQKTFGGICEDEYNRQTKNFSAYMLFYQRRAAIAEDQRQWVTSSREQSPKVPVPRSLSEEIDVNNELFIREYCLFDPNHSKFVRQLHATSRMVNHGICSEDHTQEKRALHILLAHLCRIAWRQQTSEIFLEALIHLRKSVLTCSMCCNIALKWLAMDENALMNLLLRCTHPKIRSQTRTLLVDSLKFFREKEPALYGLEGTESDMELDSPASMDGLFACVTRRLNSIVTESYKSTRGWDDLYLTLIQMAEMGNAETAVLLNHDLLEFCLRLFVIHAYPKFQQEAPEFARVMERKKGIFNRMIGFVSTLLSRMDIRLPTAPESRKIDRFQTYDREYQKFPLTRLEKQMLLYWSQDLKALAVLDKMVEAFDRTKTEYFYPGDILKWMLQSPDRNTQINLYSTVAEGISQLEPPYCDAYVRAALPFCEACPIPEHVLRVITAVSQAPLRAEEERAPSGEVVLQFLSELLTTRNEAVLVSKEPQFFHKCVMLKSRDFSIPLLLNSQEAIRRATQAFLHELFDVEEDAPSHLHDQKYAIIRHLVVELMVKIAYEQEAGMVRSYLNPMIDSCRSFCQQLYNLMNSEDAEQEQYKDENDTALIMQWQTEIEPRLRMWPDEGTPQSVGEAFDQSDYGISSSPTKPLFSADDVSETSPDASMNISINF